MYIKTLTEICIHLRDTGALINLKKKKQSGDVSAARLRLNQKLATLGASQEQ